MLSSILVFSTLASLAAAAPQPIVKRAVQVVSNCAVSGTAAVTFDDGPFIYEQAIAQSFDNVGAKASYFLNGNNYGCIYDHADEIKSLYASGHTLGSHSWSHPDMTSLSWDQIHDELWKVENAFIKILGVKPLYFRPPYGNYNDLVLAALDNRGYKKVFIWNQDTGDASGVSVASQKALYDQIATQSPNPQLILQHSPLSETAYEVVPYALSKLQGAGYRVVAVDTCMGDQGEWPYQWIGQPQQRDSSWVC
ncbi:carbohydrate deacetylase [Mrakia frigida]|uniref:chitin deacetylase n=1 Tax=Mrakia frigida TaxID=29902 RepID=UPI003FCBF5AD